MVGAGWFGIADYLGYWVPMIGYLDLLSSRLFLCWPSGCLCGWLNMRLVAYLCYLAWLVMWLTSYNAGNYMVGRLCG